MDCDATELTKCSGKLDKTSATFDMIYLMKLACACNTMTTGGLLVWPEPAAGRRVDMLSWSAWSTQSDR